MVEERMMVEYKAQSGDLIRLTMNMVRNYLVSGRRELVTEQELVFFMHTCKARKLNPFIKDCYLVKYQDREPAAIITSVDYFRKNARKQPDCRGWKCGIIVKDKDGIIHFPSGSFIADNQELMGGWASAKPDNWDEEFIHTVNLAPYIKKTREGRPTQFWSEEKQPDMIMKVAEAQLLRKLWGEEATGMYTSEEMPSLEDAKPPSGYMPEERSTEQVQEAIVESAPEAEPPKEPPEAPPIWDPYASQVQNRYNADKLEILDRELEAAAITYYPSWTGRQKHEALLAAVEAQKEDDQREPEEPPVPETPPPDGGDQRMEVLQRVARARHLQPIAFKEQAHALGLSGRKILELSVEEAEKLLRAMKF